MIPATKKDVPLQSGNQHGRRNIPSKREIAVMGESIAAEHMAKLGFALKQKNWRQGRFAEIDLIFQDSRGLHVFVEVKTRRIEHVAGFPDSGFDCLHWRKKQKIVIAAQTYLATHSKARQAGQYGGRVDAIIVHYRQAIYLNNQPRLIGTDIIHVQEAFN